MKERGYDDFIKTLNKLPRRIPLFGQIELTNRCLFDCVHCYCKNQPLDEQTPSFWRGIIDQARALGGIELTFTGGDPFCYKGFLDVYRYAAKKGFIINVFTTGAILNKRILNCFKDYPPVSIEITLNSLDKNNYARITGVSGVFDKVMANIREIKSRGLPLILKCNGLRENKEEILKIKKFTEQLLGKKRFKFDSFIFPGLRGEKKPLKHRLSAEDIIAIEKKDRDMLAQRKKQLGRRSRWFNPAGLYHCNSWLTRYFINPQGLLQFCHLTKDYSTDLKQKSFKSGFDKFLGVLKEKYKGESECIDCELKEICYKCPARAYLETGNREEPVDYFCRLARARKKGSHLFNS